jgi:hypothetical protein
MNDHKYGFVEGFATATMSRLDRVEVATMTDQEGRPLVTVTGLDISEPTGRRTVQGRRTFWAVSRWVRPYAVHYRDGWEGIAQDKETPQLTRLVALAYARSDSNGHAHFGHGEIMQILGTNSQQVQRLIDQAVRDRWLRELSTAYCLVAPS